MVLNLKLHDESCCVILLAGMFTNYSDISLFYLPSDISNGELEARVATETLY